MLWRRLRRPGYKRVTLIGGSGVTIAFPGMLGFHHGGEAHCEDGEETR
jgi:hypothetical protein